MATIDGADWRVRIGALALSGPSTPDWNSIEDFTPYVMGIDVDQQAFLGKPSRAQCRIRLDNSTGVFTPGIGSTYSDEEWFGHAVLVHANVTGYSFARVFHGVVQDFSITDTGQNSYVDLVALDAISIAAKGPVAEFTSGFTGSPEAVIEGLMTETFNSVDVGVVLPELGTGLSASFALSEVPGSPTNLLVTDSISGQARQIIENTVLPSGPMVLYSTTLSASSSAALYQGTLIGPGLRKSNPDSGNWDNRNERKNYALTDDPTDTTKLYYELVRFDFLNSEITNRAKVDAANSTVTGPAGVQNPTSISKYGVRARNYPQTAAESDAELAEIANFWVERFGTVEYELVEINLGRTNASIFDSGTTTQKNYLIGLLDMRSGVWNTADVEINNLAGQSVTQTRTVVILGRRVRVTPAGFTINLMVRSKGYAAFVLDEDKLDVDTL